MTIQRGHMTMHKDHMTMHRECTVYMCSVLQPFPVSNISLFSHRICHVHSYLQGINFGLVNFGKSSKVLVLKITHIITSYTL